MRHEILQVVDAYLVGERDLRSVEGWLVSRLEAILKSGDRAAVDLANEIDADLIELSQGVLDEHHLREGWEAHLRRAETMVVDMGHAVEASAASSSDGATNTTLRHRYVTPASDLSLRVEFVA